MHCECDLYTRPSGRHQPQANRGRYCAPAAAAPRRGACFFCFPFISKKEHLILVTTNTDTLLFLRVSIHPQHIPHPCHSLRYISCISPGLHATPTLILPFCTYPAHALFYPSLWSSRLPMPRSWKHLYIYSISTPLPPQQPALCIFHLRGWMTYILSLAPCSHSSALLHSILLLSHWPQAAAVGVAARPN